MATSERELVEPTDLCTPDGRELSPSARGWSRRPIINANLRGGWGRNKRWDYWAILAGDLVVAVTYADVDYLGMASVWWCDTATGRHGGRDTNVAFGRGIELPDLPGSSPLVWSGRRSRIRISDDDGGTSIEASWDDTTGERAHLDARIEAPEGHDSLNVVIPWTPSRFQFTSKHQARPARGVLSIGSTQRRFGGDDGDGDAWGVLDVGRGRWPYRNVWNWAGGAGRSVDASAVVGLQFGGKWTEGTGFTENGVIVDGRLSKIGDELNWDYDWSSPLSPWRVCSTDGRVDVTLRPRYDRHSRVELGIAGMHVHQVFGRWSGEVTDDDGHVHRLDGIEGFAEEARNRW